MLIYFNKRLYKFRLYLLTHHCKEAFPGPPGLRAYWAPDAKEIIVTAANLSMDAVVHNGVERKTVKPFTRLKCAHFNTFQLIVLVYSDPCW